MTDNAFDLQSALYTLAESDSVDLPTGQTATIREMTGNEQRNFMNRTKQMNGTAVQELMSACTETVNGEVLPVDPVSRTKFFLDMLSGDRQALVFNIRRHSLGSDFNFSSKCPNPECGKESMWEVDLSDKESFKIKPYKNGLQRLIQYDSSVVPGLKIQFSHLDGHAEMAILRKRNNINSLTDLELRLPQAWEPANNRWVSIMLPKLTDRVITEMRKTIREYEGGLDSKVTLICEHCQSEVQFNLLLQPDFMTPNVTS